MIVDNRSPLAATIDSLVGQEGKHLYMEVANGFWDPEGQPLTYTEEGLPKGTGLSLDPITGVLAGIPTSADHLSSVSQPFVVTVTADDGSGGSAQVSFTIAILPLNGKYADKQGPVILTEIPSETVVAGMIYLSFLARKVTVHRSPISIS